MAVYTYGDAGPNYSEGFNPEQRARIVDDWFAGSGKQTEFGAMVEDDRNPYFRYIRDNIRNRIP